MDRIFAGLNEKQIEAVRATEGPVLVISGPGSGKTRCLTHRVAHLIASGTQADRILAVTFTNKASQEIKERVGKLLGSKLSVKPSVGTFHSICARILRHDIGVLGYGQNFTILDSDDQLSIVRKTMAELEIDPKKFNPKGILHRISKIKTELTSYKDFKGDDFSSKIISRVYHGYQTTLEKMNSLDFDDLIMLTVRLFREHPEILARYQSLWKYILVDEYQDTSHDQYVLVTLLAQKHQNLFCIGDDAQSIYMFREADIRNILNFQKDYPKGQVILLEQNYRSTKAILAAAQGVISKNQNQMQKELWTDNAQGHNVVICETINERDEANFVITKMQEFMKKGRGVRDFTILYRTHAQSRAMEESLITHGIPYQIIGGLKFYERKEIKDILAYLRVLNNPQDIVSFERIFNVPPRGIGAATAQKIISMAQKENQGVIAGIKALADEVGSESKQYYSLKSFHELLSDLAEQSKGKLTTLISSIVKNIGYEEYVRTISKRADDNETGEDRIENIKELLTVARKHDYLENGLAGFLEEITLLQDMDRVKEDRPQVRLMTIHSSKGLEFPIVFVVGMEEGLFPHSRTLFEPQELEEERRLCYVALTRAQERVILTFAKFRRIFGSAQANLPSRFISEIPGALIDFVTTDPDGEESFVSY